MKALHLLLCAGLLMPVVTPTAEAQTIRLRLRQEKKEVKLDWLLDNDLFSMSQDELEKTAGSGFFVWQDKDRSRARFNPDKFKLTLKGKDVGEVLVTFKGDKISSAMISMANKGDDDEIINQTRFTKLQADVRELLGGASGVKEEARRKEELLSPQGGGGVWRGKKALYIAEWLFLKEKKEIIDDYWIQTIPEHGEFVRIRIMPPQVQLGVQLSKIRTTVTRPQLLTKVKKDDEKVVIDGVAMVDQGSKGYCAVASFERVLRLYGADVDMHDLANVAETYGGTEPGKMKLAIQRMSQKLSLKPREILFLRQKQMEILFKNYNVVAKKEGKEQVKLEFIKNYGTVNWKQVDPETLKKFRASTPEFLKFKQEVAASINKGVPIMWALQLGMFWEDRLDESFEANRYAKNKETSDDSKKAEEEAKEEAEEEKKEYEELKKKGERPPFGGGHMRLIVGYSAKYGTIYYTDSWGPGHELKSMPIDQAWATTLALWALEPN